MEKIILDLCGGSGNWSKYYNEAGYLVINVDILYGLDVRYYTLPNNVYGILSAPPCLEFSLARNGVNKYMTEAPKRNLASGMEIVKACQRIIEGCSPYFWAIENPTGILRRFLGKPVYTFHPWQYGDPWTKRTDLWGRFNMPKPIYQSQQECLDELGEPVTEYLRRQKISPSIRKGKLLPSKADLDKTHFKYTGMRKERSAFRAETPLGFARAFYEANK